MGQKKRKTVKQARVAPGYVLEGGIKNLPRNLTTDIRRNRVLYLLLIVILVYFILFHYLPMFGILMSFEKYSPVKGILGSEWVGLDNFITFFSGPYSGRLIRNTIMIGVLDLIVNFPAPIIFALLLNEVKNKAFKKSVQTISYMPYFVSMVVLAGIIVDFTKSTGVIGQLVSIFSGKTENLLANPSYWRPLYIVSNLWQGLGFGSIIYVAALSGIDQELYEAAEIDGATRWKQTLHITLPGIASTIIIMLIMRIGMIMSVGQEKTILLYTPQVYETADIISSFVYRKGLLEFNYGYSTAVSLFNSVINFALLVTTNAISKRYSETSLF